MNLEGLTISTDLIWAAANDALDLESLDERQVNRIIDVAFLLLAKRAQRNSGVKCPTDAIDIFRAMIGKERHEVFAVMYMDTQHKIMEIVKHFHGTVNSANVYPRVIMQKALQVNAAAVIVAHNHPSGIAKPSTADRNMTTRLKSALEYCDVALLDHIIVSEGETYSFADNQLM